MKATITYRFLIGIKNFAERKGYAKLAHWADTSSRQVFWSIK